MSHRKPSRPLAVLAVLALALAGCASPAATPAGGSPTPGRAGDGPLAGITVAIDPGHNGGNAEHPEVIDAQVDVITKKKPCDTTGTETDDGYAEHAFNWDVAARLRELLEAQGATVLMTRADDNGVGPCITDRTATTNKADVAVSIHADGGSKEGHGFHIMEPVLIKGHTDDIVQPSHELALAIRDAYQDGTGLSPANYIGDHGINPRDDMGGLNLSEVPKVMVECGNMRNKGDADKLTDPGWRQRAAQSLAAGITAFLKR
ncbi:hypothetical protein Afil01_08610 [Actinorhabdospora filicis]|uniref:MurNAc-LAA domain-containing protein n=1 Tax=Actinorhabdospora filicis TaxID=1785913 RepID=A0A9W6W6Z9_9ACTN|nr:N-acetylmuramoyl-L-alanine amidase [Actinorhabdospora filicis]GLZ76054.1 hypothetical protein Afil01_08610 [Actinorhabdospora filicis]